MVDTARFQLGPYAVKVIGGVITAVGRDHATTALEIATYVPLDLESVARILDSFEAEGLIEVEVVDGFKQIKLVDRDSYSVVADGVSSGAHIREHGFVQNLVTLRGDPDWCRKVRDHHLVLKAIATLGTPADVETLALEANIPPPRVRAVLGDFETEGYARTEIEGESLFVDMPPLQYPVERFARNTELLSNVESRDVPVQRIWWVVLAVAAALLVLYIAAHLAAG